MALVSDPIIDPWYDVTERAKVRIQAAGVGGVTGIVPASLGINYSEDWRSPFGDIAARFNTGVQLGQEIVNRARGRGGDVDWVPVLQELKSNIWAGGSSLLFSLVLFYVARRSATLDVVNPIKRLVKLSAPRTAIRKTYDAESGGALSATVLNRPPRVQIEIGYILRLKDAIITNVGINFPTDVTDFNGQPNEATVTLQIKTNKIFLSDDTQVDFMGGTINRWAGGV